MRQYNELMRDIINTGLDSDDRTGVGTLSVFGRQLRFDLNEGFPAVTAKKLAWKSVVSELLWFLEGSSDERRLVEILYGKPRSELKDKTTIWSANAQNQAKALGYPVNDEVAILGAVYGVQWRCFAGYGIDGSMVTVDQVTRLIEGIKSNPYDRRHVISAWQAAEIETMALPPCHMFAQFYVRKNKLSCQFYMRSTDVFLGLPFNIASYALLTHLIARECGLGVGELIYSGGDVHIYKNHIAAVQEQLSRPCFDLPQLEIDDTVSLTDILVKADCSLDSFRLLNYQYHPAIPAPMAV